MAPLRLTRGRCVRWNAQLDLADGNADSASRAAIGTAFARWKLEFEPGLPFSVHELAFLAQINEVAARNALAKDGIKARGDIENRIARQWLAQRQKFVPTRQSVLP